ncbi:hypothetical protein MNR01_13640 [Lysobacter sp. S4-A87]|nr:hypothetical protein [Lysobacter sp. S4-A87]UNK48775.1 hypothetical protein MNR01_13640 [Lysobacter sp. S4-A87]
MKQPLAGTHLAIVIAPWIARDGNQTRITVTVAALPILWRLARFHGIP